MPLTIARRSSRQIGTFGPSGILAGIRIMRDKLMHESASTGDGKELAVSPNR